MSVLYVTGIGCSGKTTTLLKKVGPIQDEYDLVVFVSHDMKSATEVVKFVFDNFHDLEIDPSRFMVLSASQVSEGAAMGLGYGTAAVVDNYDMISDREKDALAQQTWDLAALSLVSSVTHQ